MSRVVRIGERARRALVRSGGSAEPLPAFAGGPYFIAGGELIWVGPRLPAMHPRAVITAGTQAGGMPLHLESLPTRGWSPRTAPRDGYGAARIVAGVGPLCRDLLSGNAARGFGLLLAGGTPPFPLELAATRVRALARAYRADDVDAVLAASIPLLGLGTGLTPSGDDLAGAALFSRRRLAPGRRAWTRVARELSREVKERSHVVSAALFGDLVRGQSFAPLHAIADALAASDHAGALAAARELIAIGHSSGWDMFTGLAIGITGGCGPGAAP